MGAASLTLGRRALFNSRVGVLILAIISTLMNIFGYLQKLVKGIIIILAVVPEIKKIVIHMLNCVLVTGLAHYI
ncbi:MULTISPECIES: hypothetical protein [unclassified Colwellia]|uniref:hypothetical protein n=1 Tax=unclassified Colwellia TaxID=196834 RepID=UPI0015F73067|nr:MULTISPECIES: hypothetical protein [unclassified Colwellia]MBA6222802.1 hypothetical protein [Colwellia sp. MB3u-45]MBA6265991.1 hypothetical protein [Colwellia sp. MB3u-43]MBA6287396.1 hypothetical protein [Colwellia sp. MB3u-4]MBA6320431.1 hypothetical protein [Colwellia sp. MB02u-19]MBA6323318.1 hypothetical protein [Colwellia sp. MB02u-18]